MLRPPHLRSTLTLPIALGLALGGCAGGQAHVDPGLALRADALVVTETNGEKGTQLTFGAFVLHDVGFGDLSRVSKDGQVEARTQYTYALRDAGGREWSGACKMALRGRSATTELAVERKNDSEALSCELQRTPPSAAGGWHIQLNAGGGDSGRKYGDVKQKKAVVEILSRHTGRMDSGSLGPATGYELSYDDRLVATLETSEAEKRVWLERGLDVEASGVVAAAVGSLIVYESMASR